MGRRKREKLEFRFYEVPQGECALALLGEAWVGVYGRTDICLHFHNLFEIGYCHYGRGRLRLSGRELGYEDAMVTAIPAHCPHMTVSEEVSSWEYLFFYPEELLREMYPDNPQKQSEKLQTVNRGARLLRIEEHPELGETVWRILEEARLHNPYRQELMRLLLKVYLLELIRVQEGVNPEFDQDEGAELPMDQILPALRFIDEHSDRNIRAADLARKCGLSEPHFRRTFSECVNMPPMDYLNLVRVRRACQLMTRRDISMELVAAECGFASVSAFSRNFKKFLNTTPYQWKLQEKTDSMHMAGYSISALRGWDSL